MLREWLESFLLCLSIEIKKRGMEDTNKEREAFYGKENKQMRMIKGEKKNGEEEKRWQCSRAREREEDWRDDERETETLGGRERERERERARERERGGLEG